MHVTPDTELINRIGENDPAALSELYERHGHGVLAYLLGRLGDRWLAEEVLQDVMLAVWNSAADFRGESKPTTWLLAIAHHKAYDALQRRSPRTSQIEGAEHAPAIGMEDGPGRGGESDELREVIAALAKLSPEQQATIELVCGFGLTTEEASAVLGVASGTVKSRMHRARRQLRRHLKQGSADV